MGPPTTGWGRNKADLTAVKGEKDRQRQRKAKRERKIVPYRLRSTCVIRVSRKL